MHALTAERGARVSGKSLKGIKASLSHRSALPRHDVGEHPNPTILIHILGGDGDSYGNNEQRLGIARR